MELAGILRGIGTEQVGGQQRRAEEQDVGCQQRQEADGGQQPRQVAQPQRLRHRAPDEARPRHQAAHDVGHAIAQLAVALEVDRGGVAVHRRGVAGDDDEGGGAEPGQTEQNYQSSCRQPSWRIRNS